MKRFTDLATWVLGILTKNTHEGAQTYQALIIYDPGRYPSNIHKLN